MLLSPAWHAPNILVYSRTRTFLVEPIKRERAKEIIVLKASMNLI